MIQTPTYDQHNQQFYRLGVIACIVNAFSIAFGIATYYIWSYKGNTTSIKTIFTLLQIYRMGGLILLDILMLLFAPIKILMILAIYAAQNWLFSCFLISLELCRCVSCWGENFKFRGRTRSLRKASLIIQEMS